MTFDRLCQLSPELAELKRQAREAAQESLLDWYPDWVRHCRDVKDLARSLAAANSLDYWEVLRLLSDRLADVYQTARERHRRKAKAGAGRPGA